MGVSSDPSEELSTLAIYFAIDHSLKELWRDNLIEYIYAYILFNLSIHSMYTYTKDLYLYTIHVITSKLPLCKTWSSWPRIKKRREKSKTQPIYLNFVVLWITSVKLSFHLHNGFSVLFLKWNQLIVLLGINPWHHSTICMSILQHSHDYT